MTINSGGTLAGTGSLTSVLVNAGGHLSPGDAPGILGLSGGLTLASGAVMDYVLDTPGTGNEVYMPTGLLTLSDQQFSDFNFTSPGDVERGSYTLIDAGSIHGSLGNSLSGTIDGLPASLAVQGDDLLLTVVPEPSTFVLFGVAAIGLLEYAWRRRVAQGYNPVRAEARGASGQATNPDYSRPGDPGTKRHRTNPKHKRGRLLAQPSLAPRVSMARE